MNKSILIILLLLSMLVNVGCNENTMQKIDLFDSAKKVILKENGQEQFLYWELKDDNSLWEFNLGDIDALMLYRDSLKLVLGDETFKSAVAKESDANLDKTLIEGEENGDRVNAILVHSGSIAQIRKVNYLESQILNYQINRFPMLGNPTEFHGFIIKNEELGLIRVYFGASDEGWPPRPTILIDEIKKEFENGWKLIRHLHNHYCAKKDNYLGILAPSLADAQYYKFLKEDFNLEKALITNGFHTVEIDSVDFEKFESH